MCICKLGPNYHTGTIGLAAEAVIKTLKKGGTKAALEGSMVVCCFIGRVEAQVGGGAVEEGRVLANDVSLVWRHIGWQHKSPWMSGWHFVRAELDGYSSLSLLDLLGIGNYRHDR